MVPVGVVQVGCTVTLAVGVAGIGGTAPTVRDIAVEAHPEVVLVVVTEYVPGFKFANVAPACVTAATTGAVPVTVYVTFAAGAGAVIVIVPFGMGQVGCVKLAVGAAGTTGAVLMTTLADSPEADAHPACVTVKLYVPAANPVIVVVAPLKVVVAPEVPVLVRV